MQANGLGRGRIALLLCLAALAGCDAGANGGIDSGAVEAKADVNGLRARAAPQLSLGGAASFDVAYPGLSFERPVVVTAAPGDDQHLFVAEQRGLVWVFERRRNVVSKSVLLDLTDRTRANNEQGLLGLTFHPDYASNGFVYVNYSANHNPDVGNGDSVTARFTVDRDTMTAARSTGMEVLRIRNDPYNNHNAGAIAFGNDGMLYIANGDGGGPADPGNRAQDLGSLFGKILRVKPGGGIPPDNPFVGREGARGEVWAYGLRNPFRMSFDRPTGRLWAGDVGQTLWEEVNLIVKGGNYGWRKYEGRHVITPSDPTPPDVIMPVLEYDHDTGQSVTGGRVYRGKRFPGLVGKYIYGDFVNGRVWAMTYARGEVTTNVQIGTVANPSNFGEDVDGELLISSFDGKLHRLVSDETGDAVPPTRLSDTGLFADTARLQPARGVVEYAVRVPFWSDGAHKRRWIAVPGTRRDITFSAHNAWAFPRGTAIVKHFEIDLADGTRKRLETRVLVNQGGWRGFAYRWNNAGTDAFLVDGALIELDVMDAGTASGSRRITYEIPSNGDCLRCHSSAAGTILGVRTKQLNRLFLYPDDTRDNQLRALEHAGYFDRDLRDPSVYDRLPDIRDDTLSISRRARAYLDVNCSQCHRPGGPTGVDMDLRFETPREQTRTIRVEPTGQAFGVEDARRIVPGDRKRSLIWTRMSAKSAPERMPPLGSHRVDEKGAALVGEWIEAGAP